MHLHVSCIDQHQSMWPSEDWSGSNWGILINRKQYLRTSSHITSKMNSIHLKFNSAFPYLSVAPQGINSSVRKGTELCSKGKWARRFGIWSHPPATCHIIQLVRMGAVRPRWLSHSTAICFCLSLFPTIPLSTQTCFNCLVLVTHRSKKINKISVRLKLFSASRGGSTPGWAWKPFSNRTKPGHTSSHPVYASVCFNERARVWFGQWSQRAAFSGFCLLN